MKYLFIFLILLCLCGCRYTETTDTFIYSGSCEELDGMPISKFQAYHIKYKNNDFIVVRGNGGICIAPLDTSVEEPQNFTTSHGD